MKRICGIDEAGRGPLAGPVTAAAVILPEVFDTTILADSKTLSKKKRTAVEAVIRRTSVWAIGWAWPAEIDCLNIHHATLLAMKRAFTGLAEQPEAVLVDGKFCPDIPISCTAVVKGDSIHPEIMAASILAKNTRDRWMETAASLYPGYGFERHAGYPTKSHRRAVSLLGPCGIHRLTFRVSPAE
jgi:ribonuclease HII